MRRVELAPSMTERRLERFRSGVATSGFRAVAAKRQTLRHGGCAAADAHVPTAPRAFIHLTVGPFSRHVPLTPVYTSDISELIWFRVVPWNDHVPNYNTPNRLPGTWLTGGNALPRRYQSPRCDERRRQSRLWVGRSTQVGRFRTRPGVASNVPRGGSRKRLR